MDSKKMQILDAFFKRAMESYEDTDSFWDKFTDWTMKIDTKWNHEFTGDIVKRVNEFNKATRKDF